MTGSRAAVLATCCLWGASVACHKAEEDPSEAAYGEAVARFAQLSAQTQDLTYADPRFDEVLADLARVPADSEAGMRAAALAQRIRQARLAAAQAEQVTTQQIERATAAPRFIPERPTPTELPKVAVPADGALPPTQGTALTMSSGLSPSSAPPAIPDWYRQRGFIAPPPSEAPPPPPPEPAPASDDVVSGTPDASSRTPPPSTTPPDDAGPAHIFGLPGPAGRALGPP